MIDYAIELRRQFIASHQPKIDPVERERISLERRQYLAREKLKAEGKWILQLGNTYRPSWGEPDPRFKSYAEGA